MPKENRQIRVFISSTFRDMQAERDYLVKFIFPQLRKLCEERNVVWSEVDLRWGITDEQSAEEKVLQICLDEIRHCRPYFIGILGERYGWVPETIDPELIQREPWLEARANHSVTELEILHGVLNNPEMEQQAFFYFRDPAFVQQLSADQKDGFIEKPVEEEIKKYGPEKAQQRAEDRRQKLLQLKERIRLSGIPCQEGFNSPQQLGEWVLDDMTAVINRQFPENTRPGPLQQEAQIHDAFAAVRQRVYIGGEQYFAQMDEHLAHKSSPLVIVGESGSGKSALLANWGFRYQKDHPDYFLIRHFIGASASSGDWSAMLRRIMGELKEHFHIKEELPDNINELRSAFPQWLHEAGQKGKVVLIIDALNQLEDKEGAQELSWLPEWMPENVHFVLSTLPGKVLQAVEERGYTQLIVKNLSVEEREQLVEIFLKQYAKQLSKDRVKRIVEDPQSGNPLGLRILLDELRQFGYHENLDEIINEYLGAQSIPEMLQMMLARCETDFEKERPGLVGDAMRLIWASRQGISEAALMDLLGKNEIPLPKRIWSPLHLAMEGSLFERTGLINFFHDYLRQAVEQRYLPTDEQKSNAHIQLADYFAGLDGFPPHKITELPWQLQKAEEWQRLYDLLIDLDFLEHLWLERRDDLYKYWTSIEENTELDKVQAYLQAIQDSKNIDPDVINWLSILFQETGHLQESMELHKEEERICRQFGYLDGLQRSLGNQALVLKVWGKFEEALAKLKEKEQICRSTQNMYSLAIALGNQALVFQDMNRPEEAMKVHKEEEKICRQLGNLSILQASLGNQGLILQEMGQPEKAMQLHKEQERICRQLGGDNSVRGLLGLQAALGNQALILKKSGNLEEAKKLLKEQEGICRQIGNSDGLQASLGNQGLVLQKQGQLEEALRYHKQQEQICRRSEIVSGLQISLANQALIYKKWNQLEKAMNLYKEEEQISRQVEDDQHLINSLSDQALILHQMGKPLKAVEKFREQESICRKTGNHRSLANSLHNQAKIISDLGKLEEAVNIYKEEELLHRQLGNRNSLQTSLGDQALIYMNLGNLQRAMELLFEQEKICRKEDIPEGLSRALGCQAEILRECGEINEAMKLHKEEERIWRQLGNLSGLQISLINQAAILQNSGRLDEAFAIYREQEEISEKLGDMKNLCISWTNQAMIMMRKQNFNEGMSLLHKARTYAVRHGFSGLASQIENILNNFS